MRNRMKAKKRQKDSRARDKKSAMEKIKEALMALAVLSIFTALVGCSPVTDIVVDIEPTQDGAIWNGNIRGLVDGNEFSGEFTLIISPPANPDPSIPIVPDSDEAEPDPTDDVADADSADADPAIPDRVWVTPSGTKYHWICWRTEKGDGEWVLRTETENEPCKTCLNLQAEEI